MTGKKPIEKLELKHELMEAFDAMSGLWLKKLIFIYYFLLYNHTTYQ